MAYKPQRPNKTTINKNTAVEGESIEQKMARVTQNKEPIKDGATPIYTKRGDGVQPEHDIRNDKWEQANDVMGKVRHIKEKERAERNNPTEQTNGGSDGQNQSQGPGQ